MANPNRIQWNGPVATRHIEGLVSRRVSKAADILVDATKQECPVLSGDLRDTIRKEPGDDRLAFDVVVGDESVGVDYAGFVHDGTSRTAANPFFSRAIANSREAMKAAIEGRGETLLGRIGGAIAAGIGRIFGLR